MARVSAVDVPIKPWDEEIFEAVERSVELLGGPGRFANSGDLVFIKPNILCGDLAGTTDRRVLYAAVRMFVDEGCDVVVGENPLVDTNSEEEFERYGVRRLVERAGGRFIDLRRDRHVTVRVKDARGCETLRIAETVLKADCVVSMPVMKSHGLCLVTLSLKNMWGTIPPTQRYVGHRKSLNWTLAELNKIVKTKLAIIDGTTAVGAPPIGPFPLGLIIAGDDPVAADSIAALRMGYNPYEIEHIRYAHQLGVGEIDPSKIELLGTELEAIKRAGETSGREKFMLQEYTVRPEELLKGVDNVRLVMGNPCSGCIVKFNLAIKNIGVDKIAEGPEMAFILGPDAEPVPGVVNLIIGGCLRRYADKGIFIDFCPVYNQDVESGIRVALGEAERVEQLWDSLLKSYREKEDESLPGF